MAKAPKTKTKSALLEKFMKDKDPERAMILSDVIREGKSIPLDVPLMNVALGGSFDDGCPPGVTIFAGPSRHFKTSYGLKVAGAFHKQHEDGIILFYDSENGATPQYFSQFDVDPDRVVRQVVMNIEELKFLMATDLERIKKGEKVMIFVDSIGNLASKKEFNDAQSGNSAADMTRAKEMASLFRVVTPQIDFLDMIAVFINHTYNTMEFIPKQVLSGGQKPLLSAQTVWFISRSTNKDSEKNIEGYTFTVKVEKSRFVREGSKFPITVSFDAGIEKYSGLIQLAVDFGIVQETKIGRSKAYEFEGKVYEAKDISSNDTFWNLVFEKTNFKEQVENKFSFSKNGVNLEHDKDDIDESNKD